MFQFTEQLLESSCRGRIILRGEGSGAMLLDGISSGCWLQGFVEVPEWRALLLVELYPHLLGHFQHTFDRGKWTCPPWPTPHSAQCIQLWHFVWFLEGIPLCVPYALGGFVFNFTRTPRLPSKITMIKVWAPTAIFLVLNETQGPMSTGSNLSICMANPSGSGWHISDGNGEIKNILRQMTG